MNSYSSKKNTRSTSESLGPRSDSVAIFLYDPEHTIIIPFWALVLMCQICVKSSGLDDFCASSGFKTVLGRETTLSYTTLLMRWVTWINKEHFVLC